MKVINKTYKFRLYPNKQQEEFLAKHFGCVRFVYNYFLARRKEEYSSNHKSSNYYEQSRELTELKKNPDFFWLKEVNSQSLVSSLRNLDTAYQNFFKGRCRVPRFHMKKSGGSFCVPQSFRIENGRLYIPKFREGIRFVESRKIEGTLRKLTISVTASGKYFVSITVQTSHQPFEKTNRKVGIDLGIKDFIVTSDGKRYDSNKFIKKYQKELERAQKHLSRKKKGSHSWERQRIKVARIHEKIVNCRYDKMQKVSTELVRDYDVICCEDLNVKGMLKNHKLAGSISDASWSSFLAMLEYKAEWNGKQVVKIGRFYPSSKRCNHCGCINENLKLSDRS